MLRLGVTVLLLLVLVGCGGDDDDSEEGTPSPAGTETTPAEPVGESRCEAATTDVMTPLGNKLTLEGGRVRAGQLVKSRDHETLYFLSAEIDGPGLEDAGDVGTWATESRFGGGAVYSVDPLAKEHSDWSDASTIDASIDDDGAEESRECVAEAG
jgi:hypothetical protein